MSTKRTSVCASSLPGIAGYDVLRIVLGCLLLLTATLKGYQLATEPVLGAGILHSRWFLIVVVEFELAFALWLLVGLLPRLTWKVALALFIGFGAISLSKALAGQASCGCFGRVEVNPWCTLFLDAVAAIVRWRPVMSGEQGRVAAMFALSQYAALLGLWVSVSLSAGWSMAGFEAAEVTASGKIVGNSGIVVLEPVTWVGRRFPLLEHVDIADQLAQGDWVVLLYHHDCPKCQEVLPGFEQLADRMAVQGSGIRAAVLEVPPFSLGGGRCDQRNLVLHHGRLSDCREWFVPTPVQLVLVDGSVTTVRSGEDPTLGEEQEPSGVEVVWVTSRDSEEGLSDDAP